MALYTSYGWDGVWTLNERVEVWRDPQGAFASAYTSNLDPAEALVGDLSGAVAAPPATYGEVTLRLAYKRSVPRLSVFQIRPELRFDRAFGGSRPFNGGRDRRALTAAVDVTAGF